MAGQLRRRLTFQGYKAASSIAQAVPSEAAHGMARLVALTMARQDRNRRRTVRSNLNRIYAMPCLAENQPPENHPPENHPPERRVVRRVDLGGCGDPCWQPGSRATESDIDAVFVSYAQYWVDSFRVPTLSEVELLSGMQAQGMEHLDDALQAGRGAILTLPHLGGWDFGGAWFACRGYKPTVVVEALEPPQLLEWFTERRAKMGLTVVPAGPSAFGILAKALRRGEVVGLVSDRDLSGNGLEVDFFGEATTLPAGPAMLAMRTRAPILPAAVYRCGNGRHRAIIRAPLQVPNKDRLSEAIAELTASMARELEALILAAPHQWHMLQPNWPADMPVN